MSVMLPFTLGEAPKVLVLGGGHAALDGDSRSVEVMDFASAEPESYRISDMQYRRSNVHAVVLPNGEVLILGGEQSYKWDPFGNVVREAEIFDPASETFRKAAWMTNPRTYHSVALLLPDGRVFTGGGIDPTRAVKMNQLQMDYKIYSPPYMFQGPRPTIAWAPSNIGYGGTFQVTTPDPKSIAKVALVRPMAVTHHTSPEQRMVYLPFASVDYQLLVKAPDDGNAAPPGWYMLFLVDKSGVPSVAKFVHVQ